ncbi:predicted hydrolase [Bellilinea caldifistulae]|uniref:alpha/beta fold hydrolase n=1 Tax=Bellilinea caldifistulae TaxID=360411 RepID=UPI000785F76F|nr:alpha/beta hydrolase [Bellilinea caldifistulae]GAP09446.1 predicted hydrolase [Bellilinea caldifistulae]
MPQLFYGHILSDGVRIQYYRTGGQKPPIILLHGLSDNALCWNRVPLVLEVEFDVILMDARGHGSSGLDERGASPLVQAQDVCTLIETLQLHRPILIGHSMGAVTAALTAAQLPKVVRGVVLEDPPWQEIGSGDGARREKKLGDWREWLTSLKQKSLEEIIAEGKRLNPLWDESEFFQWAKAKQQVKLEALNWIVQPQPEWSEIVPQIACPGLIITGEPSLGAVLTPPVIRQIEKAWRKSKTVRIAAAGHNVHREAYMNFLREVAAFIKRLGK